MRRSRVVLVLVSGLSAASVLAGCVANSGASAPPPSLPPSPLIVVTTPVRDAREVSPAGPVGVIVTGGTLDSVSLTRAGGRPVVGWLTPNRDAWTAGEPLDFGATYTWSGTALGPDAGRRDLGGSFTTATPNELVAGSLNVDEGSTVGVAAPIMLQFDAPIRDRAAAERALLVQTSVPTEGSWAWLPDSAEGSRVHWRPKNYWKPGTSVTVTAGLRGVPLGGGAFGQDDIATHFTIGREQIVKADVTSHKMVVLRDGQPVATYDASYGRESDPDRVTRSGIHVVTERHPTKRMVSRRYNYDLVERWAVRISNNGEFIHANPASTSAQGNSNITHGCINLSTADGKHYFDSALYGDPVEVTNSSVELSSVDGDIYDWAISWDAWRGMSALPS
ncbi:L,D-transpeptidase [Saccharopolyspora shandongensis]|uniref:L,D-transpeptidase n=1 Tax=Saccharopolyspora shandongensis TaxID=418495 RepID=UPI0033D2A1B8